MSRFVAVLCLALTVAGMSAAAELTLTFAYHKQDLGKVPSGWKAARTGDGEGSVWKIVEDSTAPSRSGVALAQTAVGPNRLFNLCVVDTGGSYKDLEAVVAFKAVQGKKDQGGGIVWRYQDADNYYLARMNPLESNCRFYKVEAGKRTQLASKKEAQVPAGEWHTLKIRHVGQRVECYLDGKRALECSDDTFSKGGKVGLWTKSDARTYFDQLQVQNLDR